jgi:hypothetical protein
MSFDVSSARSIGQSKMGASGIRAIQHQATGHQKARTKSTLESKACVREFRASNVEVSAKMSQSGRLKRRPGPPFHWFKYCL